MWVCDDCDRRKSLCFVPVFHLFLPVANTVTTMCDRSKTASTSRWLCLPACLYLLNECVVDALRYDGVFGVQPELVDVQFGGRRFACVNFNVDRVITVPATSNTVQLHTHTHTHQYMRTSWAIIALHVIAGTDAGCPSAVPQLHASPKMDRISSPSASISLG